METNQTRTAPNYQPPMPTHYDRTPTNRRELETCFLNTLRAIYIKTNSPRNKNNQFSLTEIYHAYGIKDNRVMIFLQEVGILRKQGKNRGTKWFWIADIKPTPLTASEVVRKWNKWKKNQGTGKNFLLSRFPELPSVQNNREPIKVKETKTTDSSQKSIFEDQAAEAATLNVNYSTSETNEDKLEESLNQVLSMVKASTIRRQETQNRWNELKDRLDSIYGLATYNKMNNQLTQDILTDGHLYIEIPVFFGLFSIKKTIKIQ